uniref:Uncharacterized protein n=1 Tax=Plectus sambesii TaxID=2011161 RepID=A0A914UK42_9BILA
MAFSVTRTTRLGKTTATTSTKMEWLTAGRSSIRSTGSRSFSRARDAFYARNVTCPPCHFALARAALMSGRSGWLVCADCAEREEGERERADTHSRGALRRRRRSPYSLIAPVAEASRRPFLTACRRAHNRLVVYEIITWAWREYD